LFKGHWYEIWDRILSHKPNKIPEIKRMTNKWFLFSILLALIMGDIYPAKAEDHEVKQILKKIEEIEEKEEEEKEGEEFSEVEQKPGEKIRLFGIIETNYEYLNVEDIGDDNSGSSSDLFISSLVLGFSLFINEWSKVLVAIEFEDIGRNDDSARLILDEAIVTLKAPWTPLYFIGGKTVMPFGVFEDHLIEGTLAEDLYEIDEWGATLGWAPDFYGLDISKTGGHM
jgi:hypothetical protein